MFNKLWLLFSRSLMLKTAVYFIILMTIITFLVTYLFIAFENKVTEQELDSKGKYLALIGAESVNSILENAIKDKILTEEQVFDTNYQLVPDSQPPKYHTAYDTYLDRLLMSVADCFLGDKDVIFAVVVDRNGYHPTHNTRYSIDLTAKSTSLANRAKRIFDDPMSLKGARNTGSPLKQLYARDTGELIWDFSAPITVKGRHWGAFRVGFSIKSLQQKEKEKRTEILLGIITLTVILGLSSWLILWTIITPLRELRKTAVEVSKGNLEKADNLKVNRNDEIGQLADSFRAVTNYLKETAKIANEVALGDLNQKVVPKSDKDTFSLSLQKLVSYYQEILTITKEVATGNWAVKTMPKSEKDVLGQTLTKMVADLKEINTKIILFTNQLVDSSNEILFTIEQFEDLTVNLSHSIQAVTHTVNEQSKFQKGIGESVGKINDVLEETSTSVSEGYLEIEQTLQGLDEIKEKVEQINIQMISLQEKSNKVNNITLTIRDITEQINVLALNAAIEAARIGEEKKEFAVVAEEIRKLAERTKSSTEQIRKINEDITTSMNKAVISAKEGLTSTRLGVDYAGRAAAKFSNIEGMVKNANQAVKQITSSVQLQEEKGRQINLTVIDINDKVRNYLLTGLKQIVGSVEELYRLAGQLKKLMDKFKVNDHQ